jgi:hypothetical protein
VLWIWSFGLARRNSCLRLADDNAKGLENKINKIFLAVNNLLMAKQVEKGNKDDSNDH